MALGQLAPEPIHGRMETRFTLFGSFSFRQDIKKSCFVATAAPVADEAAARDFIAAQSDRAANHNCWAWRCGPSYRFNDDGEPSGTAGKPILAAIDGQALDGVAVVVTRWFGGVLLGSGGLIRAYGGTAALCLRRAEKTALIETASAMITCGFGDLARVQALFGDRPGGRCLIRCSRTSVQCCRCPFQRRRPIWSPSW